MPIFVGNEMGRFLSKVSGYPLIKKKVINEYYKLEEENYEEFQTLAQHPNYDTIIQCLIDGRVSWKHNAIQQILFFLAKGLSYLGKPWNHFIAAKIIPSDNITKMNKERALYLYAIMEGIKFDVNEAIETSILMNSARKHNLGHLTLIFELCKKAGVPYTTQEERIVPPIEIIVKYVQPHREMLV